MKTYENEPNARNSFYQKLVNDLKHPERHVQPGMSLQIADYDFSIVAVCLAQEEGAHHLHDLEEEYFLKELWDDVNKIKIVFNLVEEKVEYHSFGQGWRYFNTLRCADYTIEADDPDEVKIKLLLCLNGKDVNRHVIPILL